MASSEIDPVARLRDLLAGTAKPKARTASKSKSKTKSRTLNVGPIRRSNRLLAGVAFRAAARKAAGKELSPLEEQLLSMFKIWAKDDVIDALGKEFNNHKQSRAAGEQMFPEAVLQLHDDEAYTREHLLRDARKMGPEIAAQPEHQIVNLNSLLTGKVDSDEYKEALAKTGGGVTVFTPRPVKLKRDASTEPESQTTSISGSESSKKITVKETDEASATQHAANGSKSSSNGAKSTSIEAPLKMVFNRMYCTSRQENEWNEDEIYVAWGAGADGAPVLSNQKSKEYGDILPGKTTYFDTGTNLFNSTFRLTFNAHLEVWESDHSDDEDYDELVQTLHDIARDLADAAIDGLSSNESNEGAAVLALMAAILELVAWLVDLFRNRDDLLCERTICFDRAGIAALCNAPDKELALEFPGSYDDDDDWTGSHTVYIRASNSTPPCGGVMGSGLAISGTDFTVKARKPFSVNSKYGIGLASFKGQVVGIYGRGHEGLANIITAPISSDPSGWSDPVNYHSNPVISRPALAVVGSKLHVCWHSSDYIVRWHWTENLKTFSSQKAMDYALLPDGKHVPVHTDSSVTIAGFQDQLFMMICNRYGVLMWLKQNPDSDAPSNWHPLRYTSDYAPGLVVFKNTLYCFYPDLNNKIFTLKYDPTTETWVEAGIWAFSDEVYSSLSCVATESAVLITYRNIKGTPTAGILSGLGGSSQPKWEKHVLADTEAVGDPELCVLDGSPESLLAGWAAAYYD